MTTGRINQVSIVQGATNTAARERRVPATPSPLAPHHVLSNVTISAGGESAVSCRRVSVERSTPITSNRCNRVWLLWGHNGRCAGDAPVRLTRPSASAASARSQRHAKHHVCSTSNILQGADSQGERTDSLLSQVVAAHRRRSCSAGSAPPFPRSAR